MMVAYLAQEDPQTLSEGMRNLIFLGVFCVILIVVAICAGEPNRCVQPATSAKASSIEIRSTSGVKSPSTLIAASPSRWYSLKCPPTKSRSGQSARARRPGMPP